MNMKLNPVETVKRKHVRRSDDAKRFVSRLSSLPPSEVAKKAKAAGHQGVSADWVGKFRYQQQMKKAKINKAGQPKERKMNSYPRSVDTIPVVETQEQRDEKEFRKTLTRIGTTRAGELIKSLSDLMTQHAENMGDKEAALVSHVLKVGLTKSAAVIIEVEND